jgi:cell division control protein 6
MPEDMLTDEESLFTSPGILDIEYLPRLLPYREEQQKYLADCIKRLPSLGTNVLIHGPPGIGKTACVMWVFRELKEAEDLDVFPVYINCWNDSSLDKIVFNICRQLGINTAYRSPEELLSIVMHNLRSKKAVAVAFDEIDRMQDQSFLYHFIEGIPHKSIFLISAKRDWLAHLDNRVRSRLMPEAIEFKQYNNEQTGGILEERKNYAFVPGAWENDAFGLVVKKCFENGDIRTGLALLKASGLSAEREASRKITKVHVLKAMEKLEMKPKETEIKERRVTDFS